MKRFVTAVFVMVLTIGVHQSVFSQATFPWPGLPPEQKASVADIAPQKSLLSNQFPSARAFTPESVNQLDSVVYRKASTGEWYKHELTYNNMGYMVREWVFVKKPDTTVYENVYRYFYNYYAKDLPDSILSEAWRDTMWVPTRKELIQYDANGNFTLKIIYNYDEFTYKWIPYTRFEYYWTSDNQLSGYFYQMWDANDSAWVNFRKMTRQYNADGRVTNTENYRWDSNTQAWVGTYKYVYIYNADSQYDSVKTYRWDYQNNQFTISNLSTFTYHPNSGWMASYTNHSWNADSNRWDYTNRGIFEYHDGGILSLSLYQTWNSDSSAWQNYRQLLYGINTDSQVDTITTQIWMAEANDWLNDLQYVYTYENMDWLTSSTTFTWDSSANNWNYKERSTWEYNADGDLIHYTHQIWDDGWYDNDNILQFPISRQTPYFYTTEFFAYYSTPTGISPVEGIVPTEIRLSPNYPNPFNPATWIQFAIPRTMPVTLEVFNPLGQRVAVLVDRVLPAGTYSVQFKGTALPSGMYFYRLTAGNQVVTRQMVLMK